MTLEVVKISLPTCISNVKLEVLTASLKLTVILILLLAFVGNTATVAVGAVLSFIIIEVVVLPILSAAVILIIQLEVIPVPTVFQVVMIALIVWAPFTFCKLSVTSWIVFQVSLSSNLQDTL